MLHNPRGPYEKYIKRPQDFLCAVLALVVLSPVMLVTAVLVRVRLGAPILFTQERPGKNGKIFKLYKFRTMTDERDENGELLPDADRLPSFGQKLRATSLDELPELINIIKGDMAIVGPRPLLSRYLPYYTDREKLRHSVRPGLTGLAQVSGRNTLVWERRLALDVEYAEHITFMGDVSIVLKTVIKVIKRDDIVDAGSFAMLDLDQEREQTSAHY